MPYANLNGTAATVVSVPVPAGQPHLWLWNSGPQTAYLGGPDVTTMSGFPLPPNNEIRLATAGGTIYGVAGFTQVSPYGTVTTSATAYPGGSVISVGSGGTAFGTGSTIVLEPGTVRQEFATVFLSAAGSVTTAGALQFAHGTASTFSVVTPAAAQVRADRGAS